jgi:uncharacterized protein with PQ loop repeat
VGIQELQIVAGTVSSLLFASGTFPMLWKAYQTKDLKSYSLGNITMSNIGNLIHWVYVSSLPFGPIWFLHSFYSLITALMLYWYLRYEEVDVFGALGKRLSGFWGQVNQLDRQFPGPFQAQARRIGACSASCTCPVPCPCTYQMGAV